MKKIFACFAIFVALIFVISCGGDGSKIVNQNDEPDTGETVTDEDSDTADSEPADDSEPSDTDPEDPDNPDTTPDNGDPTPDNDADSGDTAPDADDEEPINENPDNLPECSPTSATPCIDSEAENSVPEKTNLIWSGKSPERLRWIDAVDYCKNLNEGGYSDWQLPTLAALKTLVRTCGSDGYSDGECSKFGDIVFLWSSTGGSSESQGVFFYNGEGQLKNVDETFDLRCVRKEITSRQADCIAELPENAEWNSVPQITQAWSWETARWLPSQTGLYSEEPSTEECRFKCKENYFLDQDSGQCLNPCESNPCNAVAHSTHECKASTWYQYSCECSDGYYWHGKTEGCKTELVALGNICTGQNRCYDSSSSMICPAKGEDFFGQDVQYAAQGVCTPQSFTVQTISDQNVVLDNNTGLMWQQTIPTSTYEWAEAGSYCENLEYAGYSDWRLPTPQELLTIVDNSRTAIDTSYFPGTPSNYFWSSSTSVFYASYAWYVGFDYGGVGSLNKTYNYNVRCVRGAALPTGSFTSTTVQGDVIVTDTETGLIWQKTYVSGKTWQQALSYCESLTYAGYSDWRLPNKNELASLINYEKYSPASDFPDMPSNYFCSSSTSVSSIADDAWIVNFGVGDVGSKLKIKTDDYAVRCVR